MDNFDTWEDVATSKKPIPLPHENLDQYFSGYDEIDNLFNETLNGLQDLDVPTGFINPASNNGTNNNTTLTQPSHSLTHSISHGPKHSRKISGTAIFGFNDHNRELSIAGLTSDLYKSVKPSVDLGKSISPGELLKSLGINANSNHINTTSNNNSAELDFSLINTMSGQSSNYQIQPQDIASQFLINEEDEFEEENKQIAQQQSQPKEQQQSGKKNDYIVTNSNPTSYKFPPSPSPSPSKRHVSINTTNSNNNVVNNQYQSVNNYSVKYLQDINNNQTLKQQQLNYVDDIEPLLESSKTHYQQEQAHQPQPHQQTLRTPSPPQNSSTPSNSNQNTQMKYVPIPVQQPLVYRRPVSPQRQSQPQQHLKQQRSPQHPQQHPQQQQVQFHNHQQQQFEQQQQNYHQQQLLQHPQQYQPMAINSNNNTFLPPPSPPNLSHASPDWKSSPEPQSPSPNRSINSGYDSNKFSSPVHQQLRNGNINFYTPQFFSEGDYIHPQQQQQQQQQQYQPQQQIQQNHPQQYNQQFQSSPIYIQRHQPHQQHQQLQTSPVRGSPVKYYSSPVRNHNQLTADDTIEDSNATITQLTPLKHQLPPQTPGHNNNNGNTITLEWSPVLSPSASVSLEVKKQLQQSSPRRRIKKTSLLPPGELDQYWEGPDENKIFTCTYKNCGKKFTRRYNVRSHIQTHLSDRPFGCSYCPKRFVRQHDLNRHIKGHLEARHCQCPCGKEFARLDALRKHRERNICVGGIVGCISKPNRKHKTTDSSSTNAKHIDNDQDHEKDHQHDHEHDQDHEQELGHDDIAGDEEDEDDYDEEDDFLTNTDDILLPIKLDPQDQLHPSHEIIS